MICPHCNGEIPDNTIYCPECGQSVLNQSHSSHEVENFWNKVQSENTTIELQKNRGSQLKEKTKIRNMMIIIIIICVCVVLGALSISKIKKYFAQSNVKTSYESNTDQNIRENSEDATVTNSYQNSQTDEGLKETFETESEVITSDTYEDASTIYYVKNVETGLNIRSEPKHDSALVYTVEDYSAMTYLGEVGEGYGSDNEMHTWYKVEQSGHVGWVRSDLVDQYESDIIQGTETTGTTRPFYGVWIYASKNETDAKKECNKLIDKGFDAMVIKTSDWSNLNPETYYAISIGAHASKDDAENQLTEMKRNGYETAYVKYSGDRY